jgi:hypothetical protein
MAAEGAGFLGLLALARKTGAPGNCGCFGAGHAADGTVGWRAFARAAWVLIGGLVEFAAPWPGPGGLTRPWPAAGAAIGMAAVLALSVTLPSRTPRCHRSLWRPLRHTLNRLTTHPVFAGIAATVPLAAEFTYRRAGCADEFWFLIAGDRESSSRGAFFRVTHHGADGLVVYARMGEDIPQALSHSFQHVNGRQAQQEELRK